jgi:hypothetical protein
MSEGLSVPNVPVVGNHDARDNLIDAFGLGARLSMQPAFLPNAVEGYLLRIVIIGYDDTVFGRARYLSRARRPRFNLEAPGFLMHHWTGQSLISNNVAIAGLTDTLELRALQ